jgi:hypothetical protein
MIPLMIPFIVCLIRAGGCLISVCTVLDDWIIGIRVRLGLGLGPRGVPALEEKTAYPYLR